MRGEISKARKKKTQVDLRRWVLLKDLIDVTLAEQEKSHLI
jgi:hypothetical protein